MHVRVCEQHAPRRLTNAERSEDACAQAAFGNASPQTSKAPNNAVCCAAVSGRCGGRMLFHRASPVLRATSAFKAGINGAEMTALRVAASTSCAAAPAAVLQAA